MTPEFRLPAKAGYSGSGFWRRPATGLSCRAGFRDLRFGMTCEELARRIRQMQPDLAPRDVARLCLLILTADPNAAQIGTDAGLRDVWQSTVFRMEAATDQQAAVSRELESFGDDGPVHFSPEQLWLLMRAIKVQGQLLEMYSGQEVAV